MKLAITAALIGTAAAFQPASQSRTATSLAASFNQPSEALPFAKNGCPDTLDGSLPGDVGFDPVGFSTADIVSVFDKKNVGGDTMSDLYWLREAELTHGRIAQLAVVGFIWPALYGSWPGNEATNFDFPNPVEALDNVPGAAVIQIVAAMSWVELRRVALIQEQGASRVPGDLGIGQYGTYNPLELNFDDEKYAEIQLQEIKHCRLGMLGALGLWLQACNSGTDVVSQLGSAFAYPEYSAKAGYFLPEGI
jgi:light-harvesting complex I chlorophyll a/b binding protein 1